jgi:hypothetical protein
MVRLAIIVVVALTAVARAEAERPPDPPSVVAEDDDPGFNLFGFRFNIGALPIGGVRNLTLSLGLGVEHPVFTKTRVFGEYEWMWISRQDPRSVDPYPYMATAPRPDEHGTGHRAMLGLRRELIAKNLGSKLRLYVDGELGGGLALANDNMSGVQVLPTAFGGMRAGYDIYTRNEESPSRTFEIEFLLRAIAIREGMGMSFGLGMAWGN